MVSLWRCIHVPIVLLCSVVVVMTTTFEWISIILHVVILSPLPPEAKHTNDEQQKYNYSGADPHSYHHPFIGVIATTII